MDVMRTVSSMMGTIEPETDENDHFAISIRLVAIFGPALLYWHHFHKSNIRISTQTKLEDSVAKNFIKLMHNSEEEPDALIVKTFDVSLILYAEHDYNASAFTARVTVSSLSDFYSGITSAIGSLRGPLHGGANEAAMEYLS